jgi:hypothetical protein
MNLGAVAGKCHTRKSHKTTRIVGWDSLSSGRDPHKTDSIEPFCIFQRCLRHSRSQHQLAACVAQFELSERVARVVESEDSGDWHFQLTARNKVG